MARSRYYSPRLDRDLITRLYHQAQAQRVPMTALASRLIRNGLDREPHTTGSVVAEEPPAEDPSGRKH